MRHLTIMFFFLSIAPSVYGQKSLDQLLTNKSFNWVVDSSDKQLTVYYQANGWSSTRADEVKQRLLIHRDSVKKFLEIKEYSPRIHIFIVESRGQMKELVGWETNGTAFYKYNIVTGIASEKNRSAFFNHEMVHLIAMNLWGKPKRWINEGMAVYSDSQWHGYDLYQLSSFLIDNNRNIPLIKLVKNFRSVDESISYPLIGSFTKHMDETYGRDILMKIWRGKSDDFKRLTGRNLAELEKDWLAKMQAIEYQQIKY